MFKWIWKKSPSDFSVEQRRTASTQSTFQMAKPVEQHKPYCIPPIFILQTTEKPNTPDIQDEIIAIGSKLIEALESFGVKAAFVGYSRGPTVTRYELNLDAGVKISQIMSLADDISMNLATVDIRIDFPIPRAALGIEIPNKKRTIVRMRELIESDGFQSSKSCLTVALGRDVTGAPAIADLIKSHHLLIVGSNEYDLSMCINSIITSLLYKSTPDDVRFLMIDPKITEFEIYNGIPQLLVPVITDPRKAVGALMWATIEAQRRYRILAANGVRNLQTYNLLAASNRFVNSNGQPMERMPQIVIFIDELSDLMLAEPNEVEDSIYHLTGIGRAAGIHLVIATQHPSADIITNNIKMNIPSRIAFSVPSRINMRELLNICDTEKLLGHGDMFFSSIGSQKPIRIQGCFISDSETANLVEFIGKSQEADYNEGIARSIEQNALKDSGSKT
jgi:S-DNA-T family DNA segregation ATPase FtsK/SpoIIIE